MKLSEYARRMGVSRPTIYRKLQEYNVEISSIKDERGNLTDDGLSVLSGILSGAATQITSSEPVQKCVNCPDTSAKTDEELSHLRTQLAEAEKKIADMQKQISDKDHEIMELQRQRAERAEQYANTLTDLFSRQQVIEERQLLPGKAGPDGAGIFARIRARFKK